MGGPKLASGRHKNEPRPWAVERGHRPGLSGAKRAALSRPGALRRSREWQLRAPAGRWGPAQCSRWKSSRAWWVSGASTAKHPRAFVYWSAAVSCPLCVECCSKVPLRNTDTEEVRVSSPASLGGWRVADEAEVGEPAACLVAPGLREGVCGSACAWVSRKGTRVPVKV